MVKTHAIFASAVAAWLALAGCSKTGTGQPPKPKAPPQLPQGVLVIEAAEKPEPGQTIKCYRIGAETIPGDIPWKLEFSLLANRLAAPVESTTFLKDRPDPVRLIVRADAKVDPNEVARVVMAAIRSGYDCVDLDGNMPALDLFPCSPPIEATILSVFPGKDGALASYKVAGQESVLSKDELDRLLRFRVSLFRDPDLMIVVIPPSETELGPVLAAYEQAVAAGVVRFFRTDPWSFGRKGYEAWVPPKPEVFGAATDANHVVYICDRSGSLVCSFQYVSNELLRSISMLGPRQDFALLMMASEGSIELHRKGLLPATVDNKHKAWDFMREITARPTTLLPSLRRAFDLLDAADPNTAGKAIYILSDGDFAGLARGSVYTTRDGKKLCGNEAVIQFLRDRNAKETVQVNAILLCNEAPIAKKVYKQIAEENGGKYTLVNQDEL